MSGISVKLPLNPSDDDGHYGLNKTFMDVVKQNFKNLILTIPGEKVMDPSFGCGLAQLLFEQDSQDVRDQISSRIFNQVKIYMPHIIIEEISFSDLEKNIETGSNTLLVVVKYRITPFNESDILDIKIG